jgi:hypothetical protein
VLAGTGVLELGGGVGLQVDGDDSAPWFFLAGGVSTVAGLALAWMYRPEASKHVPTVSIVPTRDGVAASVGWRF